MDKIEFVFITIAQEGIVKEAEQGSGACLLHFPKLLARTLLPNVTLALRSHETWLLAVGSIVALDTLLC